MSAKILLLAQYDLHHARYNKLLNGIGDEESERRLLPGMNNIKWLAGHLLWNQGLFAKIAGVRIRIPWAGQFMSVEGATEEDLKAAPGALPRIDSVLDKWNDVSGIIRDGLAAIENAVADLPPHSEHPHPLDRFDDTLAGLWAFANHHQAYTLGQIGILRCCLGKVGVDHY